MSSLVKYFGQTEREGEKLSWGRVNSDGLPFRGPVPPLLREEEFEARTRRVGYFRNGFFDVTKPEENAAFMMIVDKCLNSWFRCVHIQRFWHKTTKHYIEWVEYYMQDGTATPYGVPSPQLIGAGHGSSNGSGYSG